jgi:hypothetical protein
LEYFRAIVVTFQHYDETTTVGLQQCIGYNSIVQSHSRHVTLCGRQGDLACYFIYADPRFAREFEVAKKIWRPTTLHFCILALRPGVSALVAQNTCNATLEADLKTVTLRRKELWHPDKKDAVYRIRGSQPVFPDSLSSLNSPICLFSLDRRS